MKLPKTVKIGYKTYDVKSYNHLIINNNDTCLGTSDVNKEEIKIANIYSDEVVQNTLIHECIHAIDDIFQIGLEEEQVDNLANGICQLQKDNNIFKIREE